MYRRRRRRRGTTDNNQVEFSSPFKSETSTGEIPPQNDDPPRPKSQISDLNPTAITDVKVENKIGAGNFGILSNELDILMYV